MIIAKYRKYSIGKRDDFASVKRMSEAPVIEITIGSL